MDKLGNFDLNRIYTGDARILAKGIPDASVDLIFTDPPWGIGFQYVNQCYDRLLRSCKYKYQRLVWLSCRRMTP